MVFRFIFILILTILSSSSSLVYARDLGQYGQVFEIKEQDIIEYIKSRLSNLGASGELNQHHEIITKKIEKQVRTPTPVAGLIQTQKQRVFYFDPTYEVKETITDHIGQVIARAGDKINPLDKVSLTKSLVFIDGTVKEQVDFALAMNTAHPDAVKIILVNGSPLDLQEKHNIWIYFDQQGYLINKLGIMQVPAVVVQDGKKLKIEEIVP